MTTSKGFNLCLRLVWAFDRYRLITTLWVDLAPDEIFHSLHLLVQCPKQSYALGLLFLRVLRHLILDVRDPLHDLVAAFVR